MAPSDDRLLRPSERSGDPTDPNRVSAPEAKNLAGSGAAHAQDPSNTAVSQCARSHPPAAMIALDDATFAPALGAAGRRPLLARARHPRAHPARRGHLV